jgi:hypothetical protein
METSGDKPKTGERIRRCLEFVFGFENKRGEILDSWLYSAEDFHLPPRDFYDAVEKQLAGLKIPGMEIVRQEFAEGGLLSDQRLYLRLMRERLAIDTCAAPFGKIYFFSCRTVNVRALVRLWHIVAAAAFFFLLTGILVKPLGFPFAIMATISLLFALAGVLRNAGSSAFADLDALLLKIPIVSTIYEDWFRMDSYYRQDTRTLYCKLLPELIKKAAEEVCADKGVKLVRQVGDVPALVELNRPTEPEKK